MYICWNCGLLIGEENTDWEPSRLCPSCEKAMEAAKKEWWRERY
ncbi:Uncharacterized [Moorella glycerini]|uniref:Rubredoxin-like domain-containing protein n=1 Tax=Neomoorella stamsii TaxID=1266720 RepID=A0A9X7P4X6_9FIRM|nr:hypothetical protein MOST_30520 [Moorella stamsii]CEP67846.1 Uncharacterized [Moorella glycerini]